MLRHELRRELEDGLEPLVEAMGATDSLFLNKYNIAQALSCERRFVAEEMAPFVWSPPLARGSIAHKAIELSVHWKSDPDPMPMVDEAMSRLSEGGDGLADFLATASEAERAEMRAEATDRVTKFLETWPPLKSKWRPVTESRLRVEMFNQKVVFNGKVDLSIGQAQGMVAGKVLVDLKTGGFSPHHLEDLRFYALLETIRLGTPPRRVASHYLDQGRFVPENITEDVLFSAANRVVGSIERIIELKYETREAKTLTGPACRWCPALPNCQEGQTHLSSADDEDLG